MASLEQDEIDKLIKKQQEQALAIGVKEKLNKLYYELYGEEWNRWDMDGIYEYCENVFEIIDDKDWRIESIKRLKEQCANRIITRG